MSRRLFEIFRKALRNGFQNSTIRNASKTFITVVTSGLIACTTYYALQTAHNRFSVAGPNFVKRSFSFMNQRNDHNFIVNVTNKCAPSVVAIEVKNARKLAPDTGEPMLSSTGSGFVIGPNGWILTNAHVIMNKPNAIVNIVTTKGKVYEATVYDIDLKLDLALLKIPTNSLPALPLGTSGDVTPGEWVVALGSPLSLRHTVTAGVVSSINREARELGFTGNTMKFIQTDASITFGHSGGPLINLDGEVIGVNNLRVTAGIAFAIPIDYVKEFISRSKQYAKENEMIQESMKQPKFGITTLSLSEKVVQDLLKDQNIKIPQGTKGVLVWNVIKYSPADKAGLVTGDVITEINKKKVKDISDFYNIMSEEKNQNIVFTIYRKGVRSEVNLNGSDYKL